MSSPVFTTAVISDGSPSRNAARPPARSREPPPPPASTVTFTRVPLHDVSARNPYDLAVHDLVHRPGEMRERTLSFPAPEQLGEGAAHVDAGTPIEIDVRLEGLHEGILVTADVHTTAGGECVRCLDPVSLPVEVDFQELFAYSPDEAVDFAVRDDHVDLEPVVRDAVVLSLPFQPVCR